jgi:membrane-associated phospholipid phosphatase
MRFNYVREASKYDLLRGTRPSTIASGLPGSSPTQRWLRAVVIIGRSLPVRLVLILAALWLFRTIEDVGVTWQAKALLPAVLVALLATFARTVNDVKVWLFYVAGFMAFLHLRTLADETGIPHQVSYPIVMDQFLFLGHVPTAWLQDRFYELGRTGPLEIALMVVYASFFFSPHLVSIAIWSLRPALFPLVPLALMATFLTGVVIYFLVPTVPPWLAYSKGEGPEMIRLVPLVTAEVSPDSYDRVANHVGGNDVGAMPSLHMAITVVVALTAARFGPIAGAAGWLYVALMGLALVYFGEHYVIDLIAGIVLALLVWRACSRVFRDRGSAPPMGTWITTTLEPKP